MDWITDIVQNQILHIHIYCFHNIFRSIPYSNSLLTNKMCNVACTFGSTNWATNCFKLRFKIKKFQICI